MICDLGLTDYAEAYRVQREMVERRRLCEIEDSLIITEHRPVFTIGRTGDMANLLADEGDLASRGIAVLQVDRGGDITCHAPGQLVAYPILDLKKRERDLHRHMRNLEELGIRVLSRYGIDAVRCETRTGVWTTGKKIASVGIAARDWITYHGISINMNNDLRLFSLINPCGMKDTSAVSVQALVGGTVDMEAAKIVLLHEFYRVFDSKDALLSQ